MEPGVLTAVPSAMVFTPSKVTTLPASKDAFRQAAPAGSTPIDFAYSIHSAVGNKMVGARVNGRQVPVTYTLESGDRVEIVTSQNSKGPSRDWLSIVKSAQAKSKINQWFKQEFKEDNISRGKELLIQYCKSKGYNYPDYSKPDLQHAVLVKYNFQDWDSVLAAIGHGALKEGQVMNKLIETKNQAIKAEMTEDDLIEQLNHNGELRRSSGAKGGIRVRGIDDVAVHFSKCCSPVPGDEIVGYVTRGRGISIHRSSVCATCLCGFHRSGLRYIRPSRPGYSHGHHRPTGFCRTGRCQC